MSTRSTPPYKAYATQAGGTRRSLKTLLIAVSRRTSNQRIIYRYIYARCRIEQYSCIAAICSQYLMRIFHKGYLFFEIIRVCGYPVLMMVSFLDILAYNALRAFHFTYHILTYLISGINYYGSFRWMFASNSKASECAFVRFSPVDTLVHEEPYILIYLELNLICINLG